MSKEEEQWLGIEIELALRDKKIVKAYYDRCIKRIDKKIWEDLIDNRHIRIEDLNEILKEELTK